MGGSEARKPRSLKSGGGLKPSSLIEVYAYGWILLLFFTKPYAVMLVSKECMVKHLEYEKWTCQTWFQNNIYKFALFYFPQLVQKYKLGEMENKSAILKQRFEPQEYSCKNYLNLTMFDQVTVNA